MYLKDKRIARVKRLASGHYGTADRRKQKRILYILASINRSRTGGEGIGIYRTLAQYK